ncbi:MAG TPA: hypothetical protein VFV29_07180 [Actinomycetota bacterium]|nr:hypothetical protein [Actinomycetota bacterium]
MSTAATLEPPLERASRPSAFRAFAGVFVAGGVAGVVVGGLGARIAMRIAALTAGDAAQGLRTEAGATIGRITLEGTLFLIAFAGIGSALVGTAFYMATLPWLPRRRALRALAFGGLELVVFGTVLLDPGNPDFTILGRPLLNVLVLSTLFVVHGVALVTLVEPSGRLVAAVARGGRWRAGLVGVGTSVAMALTAIGAYALVARAAGWGMVAMVVLLLCSAGLVLLDPHRTRPITRPTLRVAGAIALSLLAISGTVALVDAVATIV